MKRKLSFKIILMIIIFFTTLIVLTTHSNAIDSIIEDADSFLGKGADETLDFGQIKTVSDNLYNLFFIVGVVVTVLVGMVIGIKFMTESAEEKAKIKEALVPYIIGCVIIYGAFGIWKIAINIGKSLSEEGTAVTQLTPGWTGTCPVCGETIDNIPAGVATGGRKYQCPNCLSNVTPISD